MQSVLIFRIMYCFICTFLQAYQEEGKDVDELYDADRFLMQLANMHGSIRDRIWVLI